MGLFRKVILRSARAIRAACRPALIRAGLFLTAGLAALTGSGFLLASAYGALGRALGAQIAGLILAAGLLALAAVLVLAARATRSAHGTASPPIIEAASPRGLDPVPLAVFTAAFVLARRFPRI